MSMMRGYPSIGSTLSREEGRTTADVLAALAVCVVIGALAGLVATQTRLHLGWAGHKGFLWLAPVILARLVSRTDVGATAGSLAAAVASMMCSTPLGGGIGYWPMAGVAGALLDAAIGFTERRRLCAAWAIALVGMAGMAANLVMLGGRMVTPLLQFHAFLGIGGMGGRALSYAFFGLLAGLVAAAIGRMIRRGARI